MALAATDIEQVKTIVTEMWKEKQNVVPITLSPDENNHKLDLLERIIRIEEELKHLRKEMQQSREDTNRRFAEQREGTNQLREEIKQQREDTNRRFAELREDMNRQLKIALWVVSG